MVKSDIIRKITDATPVVIPMIVVRKNGKILICIDPTDVNKNLMRRHYPLKACEEIAAKVQNCKWFTILDCRKGF